MNDMLGVFKNYILVSAVLAWCVAQIFKILTGRLNSKNLSMCKLLFATGGMPSSHSAAVSALCIVSCIEYGVSSFQFASTFILAMIVMCDAAGVRKAVGEQAKAINQMMGSFFSGDFEKVNMKELIGHTPFQVLVGMIIGIGSASGLSLLY